MSRYSDSYVLDYLAHNPEGDDPYSDAIYHCYTFLQGFRDAEDGKPETLPDECSIAEAHAYRLGRYEYEQLPE